MKDVIRSWPISAYLTIVSLFVLFAAVLLWVYKETRQNYRAVGFNDGQIYQQEQTMKKIQRAVVIQECRDHLSVPKPVEFLTIKTDSVYMLNIDGNRVQFCRQGQ